MPSARDESRLPPDRRVYESPGISGRTWRVEAGGLLLGSRRAGLRDGDLEADAGAPVGARLVEGARLAEGATALFGGEGGDLTFAATHAALLVNFAVAPEMWSPR